MKFSPIQLILFLVFSLTLSSCGPGATPTASSARGFSYIWYVALTGDNANPCVDPGTPCRTVQGALDKASTETTRITAAYSGEIVTVFHTINVAAGTYNETSLHEGYPFARVSLNATISGAGAASTIFDAGGIYGGIYINGDVQVSLRDLAIQNVNGSAPDSCVNIRGAAEVTIEDVVLQTCAKTGVNHLSTGVLTLNNVIATGSLVDVGGNGNGVSSSGTVVINGGSFSGNQGQGITNSGDLTVVGTRVENNGREGVVIRGTANLSEMQIINNGQDGSFRAGLSVLEGADVVVQNSQIDNNQHGIWQHAGNLRLSDTTVSGNPRTAIILDAGELRLSNVIVEGNGSFYAGTSLPGALAIEPGARAILRNSQVVGNLNGGIDNKGELFLIESSITDQSGSWASLFNEEGATAIIERSLIANNIGGEHVATGGVTIENRGAMNMVNTTISGNQGNSFINSGSLNLAFSTIAFNEGTGFVSSESSTDSPWLANNIVAGNGEDCYTPRSTSAVGSLTLAGVNIDSDDSCGFPETFAMPTLLLDVLADNGGPTLTHALLTGSPAIDVAEGSCPPNDQRTRARPFGSTCDAGAYEAGSTIVRISDESFDFEPGVATPTPGLSSFIVIPDQNYNCRYGNSSQFDIADTLMADTEYQPIGIGPDKQWLQFSGPSFGEKCWAPTSGFTLLLDGKEILIENLPDGLLPLVSYPPAPTATPDPDEGDNGAGVPDAPSGLQANEALCSPNGYQVSLSWQDNSDNEDGFNVFHNGQLVASVGADVTKYTHSVPIPWNQQHTYVVSAYNNAGSASSNSASENGCK